MAWRTNTAWATEQDTERVLRALRAELEASWSKEARKRGLTPDGRKPRLLHTQWEQAPPELSDAHAPRISGSTAHMAAFVAEFTALDPRRMVVVGPAGSGKSTLLILLLLELCGTARAERAGREPAVPVLLSMSTYHPRRRPLLPWLASRLAAEYPVIGSPALARELLREGRVLPLLDGLDEIPARHRAAALDRVRETFHGGLPVVLACRTTEYEQALRAGPVLYGAAVTQARKLAFPHVLDYLRHSLQGGGPRHAEWAGLFDRLEHGWGALEDEVRDARERGERTGPTSWSLLSSGAGLPDAPGSARSHALWKRWAAQVEAAREETSPPHGPDAVGARLLAALGDALTSPLMATLFTDLYSYGDAEGDDIRFRRLVEADPGRIRQTILDNAVQVLFDHRLSPDSWPDARRHLAFLARHLDRTGQSDLAWWELSRAVPPAVYGTLLGGILAVAGGLTTASATGASNGAEAGVQLGVAGLVTGLLVSWWGPDVVASWGDRFVRETLGREPSVKKSARRRSRSPNPRFSRLSTALAVGGPMGAVLALFASFGSGLGAGVAGGTVFGLILGCPAGLLGAGGPVRGPRWFRRGTGFLRSLVGGMRTGAVAGAVMGAFWGVLWLGVAPVTTRSKPLYVLSSVLLGVSVGLVLGLLSGLLNWLQAPAPADDSISPRSLLRGDRRLILGWGLLVAGLLGVFMSVVMTQSPEYHDDWKEGVVLVLVLGLWVPVAVRTWPRYLIARCWLTLRGDLPLRLMPFLEHAYDVDALRQIGGVYQFRHKEVQSHLSGLSASRLP